MQDDGPGWDGFPEVKEALNHEAKDDGIFWVNKAEFFQYFPRLCEKSSLIVVPLLCPNLGTIG